MVIHLPVLPGGDRALATVRSGLRAMTPDGTSIIGGAFIENLCLNTGHGTLFWTMACGSGHLAAAIVSGKDPGIRADDLAIAQYDR